MASQTLVPVTKDISISGCQGSATHLYGLGPRELGEEVAVISPFVWDLTPCFLSKSSLCSEQHKSSSQDWEMFNQKQ